MSLKHATAAAALALALAAAPALAGPAEEYATARAEIVNLSNRLMIAWELEWVFGHERGRDEIRRAIAAWRGRTEALPADATTRPRTRHFVVNHDITVTGNKEGSTGKGRVYWFALTNRTPQNDVQLLYFGHVVEDYVKEGGKWLFSRRQVYNESRNNKALFYPELGEQDPRRPAAAGAAPAPQLREVAPPPLPPVQSKPPRP